MAESDHGDRPVTPQTNQRRRAHRPAGPPVETGSEPKSSVDRAPTGKNRPGATPVRSAPLGRKRRNGTPAKPPVAKPPVGKPAVSESDATRVDVTKAETDPIGITDTEAGTTGDEVAPATAPDAEKAAPVVDDSPSGAGDADDSGGSEHSAVSERVSYRERRAVGRGTTKKRKNAPATGQSGRKPARVKGSMRGLGIAIAALVALGLIGAMVIATTLFVSGTNKIDDRNEQRAEYAAFARQIITNLTTLNPQNIDGSIKSFQDNTSGKAMEQAGQSMQQTVNMIKSENVSTKGTVISEAVIASGADSATVIMVSSWEMNQPNVADQQTVLQTFRWKLEITEINGAKKLTNFEWVT